MDANITEHTAQEHPASGSSDRAEQLILIVEDNPTNARLAADMLRSAGYQSEIATDGRQGLLLAHHIKPDLILTDLQMPGMDGLILTRELKASPATCHIPVVAVTAHAMQDHREEALRAGCCAFIAKPFRLKPFLEEVSHAICQQHTPSQ